MNFRSLSWLAVLLVGLVAADGQKCGGRDNHGDGKCPTGYTCKDVNDYYKQCVKSVDTPSYNNSTTTNYTSVEKFTPVVGFTEVVPRLPVQQLHDDYPDVFNIFVLALEAMQNMDESQNLSYYQFSGIHGAPYIAWEYPPEQNRPYGYCTHDSVLFVTWHRPYLLLLEQLLVKHAMEIAEMFPGYDKEKYKKAAEKVRLPYWDWASDANQGRIPDVVAAQQIAVTKPSGSVLIKNPLYSYTFTNSEYRKQYFRNITQQNFTTTVRRPSNITLLSQNDMISDTLVTTFPARKLSTFQLFSISTFSRFSAARYPGKSLPIDFASIEMIHNNIHGAVGGGQGHMGNVAVAAFDPIFWLHHAQVDRLATIYQAIFPDSIVSPLARSQPNYAFPERGGIEDVDTKLYPFRHSSGQEWTSRNVSAATSIHKYGYSYPEIPTGLTTSELKEFASKEMQKLYAPTFRRHGEDGKNVRTEWLVHVSYDESQIPGTFSVSMFIGDVPDAPEGRVAADTLVGVDTMVGVCTSFSGPHPQNYESVITGTVPLTPALLNRNLNTEDREEMVRYLKTNLHWRILKGTVEQPITSLPSLRVGVSAAEATYYEEPARMPDYGKWTTYYDATQGKIGGMDPRNGGLVESHDVPSYYGGNGTAYRYGRNSTTTTTTTPPGRKRAVRFYY
ncbi:Di-copper centre-containing protein [Wilcoxina mikolae CBS 423.85]|nr:Di-copper centre-containing protein [Wilcoxina mikolae CBS 423.85]